MTGLWQVWGRFTGGLFAAVEDVGSIAGELAGPEETRTLTELVVGSGNVEPFSGRGALKCAEMFYKTHRLQRYDYYARHDEA